jgi:S-methylmethionine-dependent homocysteine/selenocysteine methylase
MGITILDGSIGQELVHRSGKPATPWWSTTVMLDQPDLVKQLHKDYFAAGAEIATTNTYALLPDRVRGSGFEDKFAALLGIASKQAKEARDEHGSGKVAGALGPLGASYRTDFSHSVSEARELYGVVIEALEDSVDFFIAETVSSLSQARNVIDVLGYFTAKPAWIAFSVDDDNGSKLRSGEALKDVLPLIAAPNVEAILINCTKPEVVETALKILSEADRRIGAYANGFTKISDAFLEEKPTVDVLSARIDLSPKKYADFAETWVAAGATIIGGCCEVGPAHIAELARRFK